MGHAQRSDCRHARVCLLCNFLWRIGCGNARIWDRMTNRKMVYDLSLFRHQVEMPVHLIIVEGTYAGGTQAKCLSGEIQAMANSACFKMYVAITTVAIDSSGTIEIADHRKGKAGVTSQVLPEAQTSGRYALVAALHLLQLGTLRPASVDSRL